MQPLPVSNDALGSTSGHTTITVDPQQVGQTIDGFGAALTHSAAYVLDEMPATQRNQLMTELFDPTGPVRLSMLRIPIGASDFVPRQAFTFDDQPAGDTDWNLDQFSTAPDQRTLQPLLRQALALNPDLKIIASPWSPPAWLKTTDSLEGGRLLDQQRAYDTYARYLTKFVQDYRAAGIPIWALTVQNEPQQRHPDGYPGTDMPVFQEAKLIEALGPDLQNARLSTAILGFDHNWALHPADAASTPAGEDPHYQYPADLLRTSAARWLTGTAYHCYYGDAASQTALHDQFADKGIWVTECSGSHGLGDSPAKVFADTLQFQATSLLIPATRNWAKGVLLFNLALSPGDGPHLGGCSTCTPLVTVNQDATVTRNADYYALAHAGRFVHPGAVRIGSTGPENSPINFVAFSNPDGTVVVIAYNPLDQPTPLNINAGANTSSVTAPPHSLISLIWPSG